MKERLANGQLRASFIGSVDIVQSAKVMNKLEYFDVYRVIQK